MKICSTMIRIVLESNNYAWRRKSAQSSWNWISGLPEIFKWHKQVDQWGNKMYFIWIDFWKGLLVWPILHTTKYLELSRFLFVCSGQCILCYWPKIPFIAQLIQWKKHDTCQALSFFMVSTVILVNKDL